MLLILKVVNYFSWIFISNSVFLPLSVTLVAESDLARGITFLRLRHIFLIRMPNVALFANMVLERNVWEVGHSVLVR